MLAALSGELLFQEQRGAKPLDTALQIALSLVLTNTSIVINTTSPIVQHKHKSTSAVAAATSSLHTDVL
jgi:hypothetical protein